jgi:predicted metal-binding protein
VEVLRIQLDRLGRVDIIWDRLRHPDIKIPEAEKSAKMAKRRGNPNWGKPEPIGPVVPTITEFEQVVKEFKLQPDQYIRSTRLREWARKNKNSKYIPEPLLEAWGFEIESTL